ncbi:hypothetical protein TRAPUB_8959 [Trametes pubescens]|uniref:Uncharacterized protein n=1 Tax=Trametes pubescens TaxID=154538 RepID=A0A1M2W3Z1_TRAPU|nr:hypothetical protein TRAPUB_5401 [Trametes pubescens]OJT14482.1 hypothetical protein TRAPUB_8964 [Trametes pubescens]OJT14486.1 hypothetical protein TRAPUB_8959 [Trametes pubescens]
MSSHQVPRKRYRGSNSPDDSDEQDRTPAGVPREATYLTPPPSSPPQGMTASSQGARSVQDTAAHPDYTFELHTARDVYLGCIRKLYPDLDVVNLTDFQVMALSSGEYEGSMAGIQQWLKDELDSVVELQGEAEQAVLDAATEACNERVAAVGLKPSVGATNVSIRPVTGTEYSMRLWPASEQLWCFDFVHSTTHQPKNAPFEFELWAEPLEDPTLHHAPWLPIGLVSRRLYSMEFGMGYGEDEIEEGEEKFAFMDGQTCVLKRPGHRDIRFTVPNRHPVVVVDKAEVVVF